MKNIFKYCLELTSDQILYLPQKAKILKVSEQNNMIFLWALIDSSEDLKKEKRVIKIFGTGHAIKSEDGELLYLDSLITNSFVWHFFELKEADYDCN